MEHTLNRRRFLGQTAGVMVGASVIDRAAAASEATASPAILAQKPALSRIGLQLYTISDRVTQDLDLALEAVARIGFKFVEFAGYASRGADKVRATLDRLRLSAPSSHIGLAALRTDLDAQIQIAQTIGHEYITVPSLGDDMPTTGDGWKKIADEFNAMGARLKAKKIGLAFHSHRDEFMDVGGKTGMDIFIAGTDPSLVTFELDLGWAIVAGQKPVEWFAKYPGRFKMWHVKDILALQAAQETQMARFRTLAAAPPPARPAPAPAAGVPQGTGAGRGGDQAPPPAVTGGPVPVGAGEIDFRPIFAQWKTSGMEYFFVEQDAAANWPGGSLVAIATSYRNVSSLIR